MPMTRFHCCLDISGGIKNARMWRNCITVDRRLLQTEKEVRAFFREQQAMGRKVLPIGDCDNFDYQTGCMGHPVEEAHS